MSSDKKLKEEAILKVLLYLRESLKKAKNEQKISSGCLISLTGIFRIMIYDIAQNIEDGEVKQKVYKINSEITNILKS